jgi:hypothetical protein
MELIGGQFIFLRQAEFLCGLGERVKEAHVRRL